MNCNTIREDSLRLIKADCGYCPHHIMFHSREIFYEDVWNDKITRFDKGCTKCNCRIKLC